MTDAERALRGEIIRTCLAMEEKGINQGTSGNVSARWQDGLLITPSGLGYATMAPEDIVFLAMDGTSHGPHAPSSEWRFHRDIMRGREDVMAIVHAHPPYLTGLSMLHEDIPAAHYMIAAVGGPTIRCAPYATYGTDELSANALTALEGRLGCILSNHGVIACGPSLSRALWLAVEMETLAQQYVIARQAGTPVVLSDEEIARVVERFKSYGPRRKDEPVAAPPPEPEQPAAEADAAGAAKPAAGRQRATRTRKTGTAAGTTRRGRTAKSAPSDTDTATAARVPEKKPRARRSRASAKTKN